MRIKWLRNEQILKANYRSINHSIKFIVHFTNKAVPIALHNKNTKINNKNRQLSGFHSLILILSRHILAGTADTITSIPQHAEFHFNVLQVTNWLVDIYLIETHMERVSVLEGGSQSRSAEVWSQLRWTSADSERRIEKFSTTKAEQPINTL